MWKRGWVVSSNPFDKFTYEPQIVACITMPYYSFLVCKLYNLQALHPWDVINSMS